ncbi:hypothetical protein INT47_003249 [Mucor saturninus]|uniref:Uncharacterized protein n=1 Tax=Mucor saturninus TaxID=64648 RepID=A0A8H7VD99_9FUNG|nr:hypothetical protein INT47_003249 [Mucor saturninus]
MTFNHRFWDGRDDVCRENTPYIDSQKKFKGKGKAAEHEPDITSTIGIPDSIGNVVSDNLIDYSSDDFNESSPTIHTLRSRGGFKYGSGFTVAESCSSVSKRRPVASKRSPTPEVFITASESSTSVTARVSEKISKRVITVKTTAKNIWKPLYLQPLYGLVNTTNSLITHTFAFTKYIYLQELAASETFT